MKIHYSASGFPASNINKVRSEIDVSWSDLVWATITVGKSPEESLMPNGIYTMLDALSRTAALLSTLEPMFDGYLTKTKHYEMMDKTEKGFASYSHGMMVAKLFASRLLGIHWLTHLTSVYVPNIAYQDVGKSRPDLIGWTWNGGDEYSVFEAKGRSNAFAASALNAAKSQTNAVRSINGQPPSIRVATESHYIHGRLAVMIEDPEGDGIADVEFANKVYMQTYYRGLKLLEGDGADIARQLGIEVRLHEIAQKALETGNYTMLSKLGGKNMESDIWRTYPDGVQIKLDGRIWNAHR
jgi:hypothetical protein